MGSGAVSILYDGDGNRVAKTVGGVTTNYLVDDLNPTGYAQVIEEVSGGTVQREYTYGLQRISENQPVSGIWTSSVYGYDGGGSVRQLTNLSGAVTDTYNYDAFGNLLNSTGTTPNNYLYRGEQYDPDLNLYYLRARYYNPATGRFMSRDPQDGELKEPASLHKYLYAKGDPVNLKDPTGRDAGDVLMINSEVDLVAQAGLRFLAKQVDNTLLCIAGTLFAAVALDAEGRANDALLALGLWACTKYFGP
jgi:RHS repeat-associated protein